MNHADSQTANIHNSTTVWTQPQTDEQRRYYSKHAGEKRVFGWITTVFQAAHGFIAFAAWTAIYIWVFKNIPALMFLAPWLAGFSLLALHVLFRTTWQTFWYDKLDDDPKTDSPIFVPAAIVVVLLFIEVQGARQYLAGQVKPIETQGVEHIAEYHSNTTASIELAYRNEVASIESVYKAKLSPIDRQIYSLRARATDDEAQRRQNRARIGALQTQRDKVLQDKADRLDKALATATEARNNELRRREQAVAAVDNHNAGEMARYSAELGSVDTYAWVLSVGLLLLIAGLSYRTVRINVKSGIIPLRNYTVLDAHGSLPERLFTAFADAINRRGLQFAVWIHRLLSPNHAITSFDGTVVANPGTYNTPEGFIPPNFQPQQPVPMPGIKTETEALKEVMAKMVRTGKQLTPEQVHDEVVLSLRSNGSYPTMPWKHEPPGKTEAPAAGPQQQAGAERYAAAPDYPTLLARWQSMVQNQLHAYDQAVIDGQPGTAKAIQDYIFTDATSPIVKEGKRLHLVWGVQEGDVVVRHRDRTHWVPLSELTETALHSPIATPPDVPVADEDESLFKYDLNKFKQEIQAERDPVSGKVIGVKYKKSDDTWGNIGLAQVKAYWNIYRKYCDKPKPSNRVKDNFDKWSYALSLFDEGREVVEDNLQTVTM